MTGPQTIKVLAATTQIPKKTVATFFDELAMLARHEAKHGFTVPGIGKLTLANRTARMGRNPQTGEALKIPAKRLAEKPLTAGAKAPRAKPGAPAPAPAAPDAEKRIRVKMPDGQTGTVPVSQLEEAKAQGAVEIK